MPATQSDSMRSPSAVISPYPVISKNNSNLPDNRDLLGALSSNFISKKQIGTIANVFKAMHSPIFLLNPFGIKNLFNLVGGNLLDKYYTMVYNLAINPSFKATSKSMNFILNKFPKFNLDNTSDNPLLKPAVAILKKARIDDSIIDIFLKRATQIFDPNYLKNVHPDFKDPETGELTFFTLDVRSGYAYHLLAERFTSDLMSELGSTATKIAFGDAKTSDENTLGENTANKKPKEAKYQVEKQVEQGKYNNITGVLSGALEWIRGFLNKPAVSQSPAPA